MQGTPIQELAYRYKTVVVAIGSLITLVKLAIVDDAISLTEADGIITAVLLLMTTLGVWKAKNGPSPTEPPEEQVSITTSDPYFSGEYGRKVPYGSIRPHPDPPAPPPIRGGRIDPDDVATYNDEGR